VRIAAIEITANFREQPERAVAASPREIPGMFGRVAAELGG
jgi:hypothetical protein